MVAVVLRRIMVLVVEGGITGRPVHHAGRLSVHHVAHRRVRTVRPARTCRQWRKHYTLLRLELRSVIGKGPLDMLVHPRAFPSRPGTPTLAHTSPKHDRFSARKTVPRVELPASPQPPVSRLIAQVEKPRRTRKLETRHLCRVP